MAVILFGILGLPNAGIAQNEAGPPSEPPITHHMLLLPRLLTNFGRSGSLLAGVRLRGLRRRQAKQNG